MSQANEAFGIMDQAYFVPRGEILNWVNQLLHINVPRIQAFGAGSVYCQIMDIIYPGKISISKVNWKARLDYEFISNLKILQSCFDRLGIKKHLEVEKIARAKYQDNLELIQWFKRFYDVNCGGRGDNYPAEERRGFVEPDFSFSDKIVIPKTYNGNGDCTYNAGCIQSKPKRQEPEPPKKQGGWPTNLGNSNSQNVNYGNYGNKGIAPSVNDKKMVAIREILGSGMQNEQKLSQINDIVNT